jgi:hypothetical protein
VRRKVDHSRANGRGAGGIPLCAVHPQNKIAVAAHFGPARQGPGRDPGKGTKLIERMEVHEGVSRMLSLLGTGEESLPAIDSSFAVSSR